MGPAGRRRPKPPSFVGVRTDVVAVHLAEYQALRQEVQGRQTLSYTIIAADLAALAAGVSIVTQYPGVLIALAVVSNFLWLFWLAQTMQVYRIATYVALELRPLLMRIYGQPVLGWESYVRRITASRDLAARALYPDDPTNAPHISRNRDGVYISLLLGGVTPPLLTIVAIFQARHDAPPHWAWVAAGVSLAFWIYAAASAIQVMMTTKHMSNVIIGHE